MTSPQQAFGGMPRRLLQVAPARLTTYLDCPRRYRMAYLDRPPPPKGPPWAHNSLGAAVHTALAGWWRLAPTERTPDSVERLLREGWLVDGYRDERQRAAARTRAVSWVRAYVAGLDPTDEPVGIERTVALKTDHAALFGRVDRIDDRGEQGLVVVDYKTGRHLLSVDDVRTSVALAVYAAAAERTLRRRCRRVELHHLPSGDVHAWEHTDEALTRHLRRVDSVAAEIGELTERYRAGVAADEADEMFPANVGPLCGWCDFNRACPAGSARVPPRESWAGIDA
jgi:RecB family exonuclease